MTGDGRASPAVRRGALAATLLIGVVQCWRYRHFMYPDGAEYLDVARLSISHGPAALINGYWSPLYPFLISIALRLLRPSIYWTYAAVQLVNAIDFVAALFAFEFFLGALIARRARAPAWSAGAPLSPNTVRLVSYAIFLVTIVYLLNVRAMSPDMIVATVVFGISGWMLRDERRTRAQGVAIGVVLGLGYLAKTVMLFVGAMYLAAWLLAERGVHARRCVLTAVVTFAVVAVPWIAVVSASKGRLSVGDVGPLAYAWYVNGAPLWWTGAAPFAAQPPHPLTQIASAPPAYAAEWHVPVTYGFFYDASYWMDGLRPLLRPSDQWRALGRTAGELSDILAAAYAPLGLVIVGLLIVSARWREWLAALREWRAIWIPAAATIALYLLVHVEGRLIAGQLQVLLTLAVAATAVRRDRIVGVQRAAVAASLASAAFTAGPTAAGALHHMVLDISQGEAHERWPDWEIARALAQHGVTPGTRVAVIGNNVDVAWAQLAQLSIVAEVPDAYLEEYVTTGDAARAECLDAFARLGVTAVVARSPASLFDQPPWTRLGATPFAIRRPR